MRLWLASLSVAALTMGSSTAMAQLPVDTSAKRVKVDNDIHFSVYCAIATGNLKLVAGAIQTALTVKLPVAINPNSLFLSKGETRCYTHRAWLPAGIAPRLDATAKPKFYLKEFADGKMTAERSANCGSPAVCVTGSAKRGAPSEKTNGFMACFEWAEGQTSDKKPRSFLVALGAVSNEAIKQNLTVQPTLCSARPAS